MPIMTPRMIEIYRGEFKVGQFPIPAESQWEEIHYIDYIDVNEAAQVSNELRHTYGNKAADMMQHYVDHNLDMYLWATNK